MTELPEVEVGVTARAHPDGAEEDLRSLLRWLDTDESLRREVRGHLESSVSLPADAMGTGFDILQLILGSGFSSSALAVSIMQWRDSRHNRPGIILRRGHLEIEIPADRPDHETLERVIAFLDQVPAPPADDEPAP